MVRNFHEDLKSRWLFVDVVEGFVVILVGFVLLLGEFLHLPVPFFLDIIESSVDLSFDLPLFAGVVVSFLPLSFVLGYFSAGGGRRGWGCEGGCWFSVFESPLIRDMNGEGWW